MPFPAQYASATYALGAVCCWGISDFLGGYTARKFNSFFLAMLGHAGGFSMVFAIAAGNHMELPATRGIVRSEEHTSELQSRFDIVCRLLLEKKNFYVDSFFFFNKKNLYDKTFV